MKKIMLFIKDMSLIYFILTIVVIFIGIKIKKDSGIDIGYIRVVLPLLLVSLVINFAFVMFKIEKLPTFVRITLGYFILFYATLIIRKTLGVWMFKKSMEILIFTLICTVLYFFTLFILVVMNKKEQSELNNAINDINEDD